MHRASGRSYNRSRWYRKKMSKVWLPFTFLMGLSFTYVRSLNKDATIGSVMKRVDTVTLSLPLYGRRRLIVMPSQEVSPVEVVTLINQSMSKQGIVFLLHACTHNALKFFSPNSECPDCIGLAEELRIARLVKEYGYFPVAVTSVDSNSGCWSDQDIPRLRHVLHVIQEEHGSPDSSVRLPTIAIGASSGGYMAAKIAAEGLVQAALVMVMGLQQNLQNKLLDRKPPLYLAPMPRDQRTLQKNQENYSALVAANYTAGSPRVRIALDTTSCAPLPVTEVFLTERVPEMSNENASRIVAALKEAGHLDTDNSMFQKDPTSSDWRDVLLALDTNAGDVLWGHFRLTPGKSPLAKALHRAWAFHEYCSESVHPALEFFNSFLSIRS